MTEHPDDEQQSRIYRKSRQLLADLNGGKEPTKFREWRQIAARFDIRYHVMPGLASPAFYYDNDAGSGDLFLPAIRDRFQLHCWIMHEMIEFLYSLEVCPAMNYPEGWGTHHDMARIVDQAARQDLLRRERCRLNAGQWAVISSVTGIK